MNDDLLCEIRMNQFRFKKSLGQNFIFDKNLLSAIVNDSGVSKDDLVVEIGAGAGTLTRALAQKAKRVVSFEIDRDLEPILSQSLKDFENTQVVYADFLKQSDHELATTLGIDNSTIKVVANLPYNVATAILIKLFYSSLSFESITIMLQKEVAQRLVAVPNSKDYGVLSVTTKLFGTAKLVRFVPREVFKPIPKVDSAVVRIDISKKFSPQEFKSIIKVIRQSFSMRRKTLSNNLASLFGSKEKAQQCLKELELPPNVRAENLEVSDFVEIAKVLKQQVIA